MFIRQDLPLHAQLVQACHASLELGFRKSPLDKTSFLILLTVKNQEELQKTKEYLDMNEVDSYMFFEPDFDMGFTALCTEAIFGEKRKLFKKFKLWKQ